MVSAAYWQLSSKVVPKLLKVYETFYFLLFKHFVEHEKLILVFCAQNIRVSCTHSKYTYGDILFSRIEDF